MDFLKEIKQQPELINVTGIDTKIPVQRFSWEEWAEISTKIEGQPLEMAILYLINEYGYEHNDEDVALMKKKLNIGQIYEVYQQGLLANGIDLAALKESKGGESPEKKN